VSYSVKLVPCSLDGRRSLAEIVRRQSNGSAGILMTRPYATLVGESGRRWQKGDNALVPC
jgi:hypothetical protein